MPFKKESHMLFFLIILIGIAIAIISFAFNSHGLQRSAISPSFSRASGAGSGTIACVCPFRANGGYDGDVQIISDCSGSVGACGYCKVHSVTPTFDDYQDNDEQRPCGEVAYPQPQCHCPPVPSGASVLQSCPVTSSYCISKTCKIVMNTPLSSTGPWQLDSQLPSGVSYYSAWCSSG